MISRVMEDDEMSTRGSQLGPARGADRRMFLGMMAGALSAGAAVPQWLGRVARAAQEPAAAPPEMLRLAEKTDLILLTDRPPNLEMPLKFLREDLTPNEAFYVRWHLALLPTRINEETFRLTIAGHVETPLSLSLSELRTKFGPVSVVAVNQCSGNSRSLYEPRMPGVQWGHGAIGNAKWTGVRLKDVLAKAGAKAGAVDVTFNGLDGPVLPPAQNFAGTPDFVKSLPFDRANDGEVMIAYEMNGQPLPMLNGFPLRLVVPGWYATYWVKSLNEIKVVDKPFDGFWMSKAYRVPNTPDFQESPEALAKDTVPISRMTVRSLFVRPEPKETIPANMPYELQGLALDQGKGIAKVEVSTDGGATWTMATLNPEIGKYSWRRWRLNWKPAPGQYKLIAKASNTAGETQTHSQWNRSGYARNVIESVDVQVSLIP
jgi:DMSO/TMAO reductase YedYZ molybdopterin-dependent catalytic subunit